MVSGGGTDRTAPVPNDPVARGRNAGSACVARCGYQLRTGHSNGRDWQGVYGRTRNLAGIMYPGIG